MRPFTVALICGGPSLERGISLNSARSVCDHLQSEAIKIVPIYLDYRKNAYRVSRAQLYSNTPSDFDFKLHTTGKKLTKKALLALLKKVDLVFPVMHGAYGEDGGIQTFLEKNNIPFVGSGSRACRESFGKHVVKKTLEQNGFFTLPSIEIKKGDRGVVKKITDFFADQNITRAIVKPSNGGSSIGVHSVATPHEAARRASEIIRERIDTRVTIEPFCTGKEFTVIILQNPEGEPVAILPTEINLNYNDHQIFDYRKKYLASRQVSYHCPPRFADKIIYTIRQDAQKLFHLFGLRDFARFDGWVLPDGRVWFSDFNTVSGMEQNSFLFMQAARIGLTHRDVLRLIITSAATRFGLRLPAEKITLNKNQKKVNVIFGGTTAERQVSVMSGTNVWLKLQRSHHYVAEPYLLDTTRHVWHLPYAFTLNHTVEEITELCKHATRDEQRLSRFVHEVQTSLHLPKNAYHATWFLPQRLTLEQFIKQSAFVFIGLHGGIGEDGTLQQLLEKEKIPFNGSGSIASAIGMNKFKTGEIINTLKNKGIYSARKKKERVTLFRYFSHPDFLHYWKDLVLKLKSKTIIVKPVNDGCSAGIARLSSADDLRQYVTHAQNCARNIPPHTLTLHNSSIEMPTVRMKELLFEEFIDTDQVITLHNKLEWKRRTDWIEITMGLLEKNSILHALHPSITVATSSVLSLEEKFQGGTGVNITPPPTLYVPTTVVQRAMKRMETVAQTLGLQGYARVDAFLHIKTGELIIIEVNTAPGLTPSTVIYHQALTEHPPLYPVQFLEDIITAGIKKSHDHNTP